ncbi:hypothetical protein BGP_3615 [Beggiatoa sp. PS]|nr:hypothetical protein BGP_3615 [Beggiatoa sp. PS]
MLATIKEGVQVYGQYFKEVTQLMGKRHQMLSEVLNVQGPLAEKNWNNSAKVLSKRMTALRHFMPLIFNAPYY